MKKSDAKLIEYSQMLMVRPLYNISLPNECRELIERLKSGDFYVEERFL